MSVKEKCTLLPQIYQLYMNIIKRVKRIFKKRKEYYFSRYYYRQLIDKYTTNLSAYSFIVNKTINNSNKETHRTLLKGSKITFNSSISETKKVYGNPYYTLENQVVENLTILFYRMRFANEKVKCEFHYYKNKLFYIKYIFSYLTENQKKEIIKVIQGKYLKGESLTIETELIIDEFNNGLTISQDSHFNIEYLALNSDFITDLNHFKTLSKIKQEENSLKFINFIAQKL